jgi:DNA-binding MarR family transcriptional regulator
MPQPSELRDVLKGIRRIARAVELHSRRIDRDVGLTLPQLVVLLCVRDLGEVTSRAVSVEANLSPPTVVGILDKLEVKGLIERYRSKVDRRIVHTRVTERGTSLLNSAPPPLGSAFEKAFNRLAPPERAAIVEMLNHLADICEPDPADAMVDATDHPDR